MQLVLIFLYEPLFHLHLPHYSLPVNPGSRSSTALNLNPPQWVCTSGLEPHSSGRGGLGPPSSPIVRIHKWASAPIPADIVLLRATSSSVHSSCTDYPARSTHIPTSCYYNDVHCIILNPLTRFIAEQVVCGRCSQALVSLEPHTCPPRFLKSSSTDNSSTKSSQHNTNSNSQPAADASPLVSNNQSLHLAKVTRISFFPFKAPLQSCHLTTPYPAQRGRQ